MNIFKRSKGVSATRQKKEVSTEIVDIHNEIKRVADNTKQSSNKLNTLLVENGFTLKIYIAAGGKPHAKRKT